MTVKKCLTCGQYSVNPYRCTTPDGKHDWPSDPDNNGERYESGRRVGKTQRITEAEGDHGEV
jgi:hypothetical protein